MEGGRIRRRDERMERVQTPVLSPSSPKAWWGISGKGSWRITTERLFFPPLLNCFVWDSFSPDEGGKTGRKQCAQMKGWIGRRDERMERVQTPEPSRSSPKARKGISFSFKLLFRLRSSLGKRNMELFEGWPTFFRFKRRSGTASPKRRYREPFAPRLFP